MVYLVAYNLHTRKAIVIQEPFIILSILPPLSNMFLLVHELADRTIVDVIPTSVLRGPAQSMRSFKKNLRVLEALQHSLLFRRKVQGRLARQLQCTPISMIPFTCHSGMMKRGVTALRMYHALQDEAQSTVIESRRVWLDTPFSIFAIQCQSPSVHVH